LTRAWRTCGEGATGRPRVDSRALRQLLERVFPGMRRRPLWLGVVAALCLVVYHHHGAPHLCPAWFRELSARLTGIEPLRFHEHLWSHVTAVVVLLLAPLVLGRLLEGWKPGDLGLSVRGAKREFLLVLGLWLAFLPVVWVFSRTEGFAVLYPRLPEARGDVALLLAYDGAYLVKWIAWEFFFRGFLLFGFRRDFGTHAVVISTIPFVLMHFGKPQPEVYGSLPAGLILCWIALRSNSIWPGVVLHWLVASSMDAFGAF